MSSVPSGNPYAPALIDESTARASGNNVTFGVPMCTRLHWEPWRYWEAWCIDHCACQWRRQHIHIMKKIILNFAPPIVKHLPVPLTELAYTLYPTASWCVCRPTIVLYLFVLYIQSCVSWWKHANLGWPPLIALICCVYDLLLFIFNWMQLLRYRTSWCVNC